ncbi:MAG: hypothetical protein JO171_08170 [Paludibacterium sp.]|uniref:hypothetical protein n=1 Tax=Paludibacterium sp. TaxID=1917523 RepID=UPI0025FB257E|nr:hypothetical protein [Paludibacterium sp.]MBV8047112.1 hypothetical protein [Paludibacterium sp.]MBV8649267.1 hypothetical protein [Paludibacterium sp.]
MNAVHTRPSGFTPVLFLLVALASMRLMLTLPASHDAPPAQNPPVAVARGALWHGVPLPAAASVEVPPRVAQGALWHGRVLPVSEAR